MSDTAVTSRTPFHHPAAWRAADLGGREQLAIPLEASHRSALLDALHATRDLPLQALDARSFDLSPIAADLDGWRREMREGRGIVLLAGLPVDELSAEESARMFFGLGTHFGVPVSQNNLGDLIGHVVNIGGQDRNRRAYQNARSLNLHTDRCDYVGMLCLRPAAHGGVSGFSSALTVHNELVESEPELLEPLYAGYRLHRFGEQAEGAPETSAPVPVFSVAQGVPNVVYIRGYIDLALEEGHYELAPVERRALDRFDEIANRPDVRFDMVMQRGDATFTNNSLLLHRRTAFEDVPDERLRRHLVRLWLMDPDRPAVDAVRAHKSMHGIEKIAGRGTYYRPGAGAAGADDPGGGP